MATEEIEVNFRLDPHGRTSRTGETTESPDTEANELDYTTKTVSTKFSSSEAVLDDDFDELLFDCEIADSGLMPRTFWVPADTGLFKPRFRLEQLALEVFRHHTKGASYDAASSGAEWWVQLRPSPENTGRYAMHAACQEDDENDLSKEGISFHWDKDEDLRILCGGTTYVHPHISTVTYMTSLGAPTFSANCRVNNLTGQYIIPSQTEGNTEIPEAFVSWPATGKHLSFDGRFLHSAPPNLLTKGHFDKQCQFEEPKGDPKLRKKLLRQHRRVTFLVNIWLNYHPFDVKPFPETMVDKMSGNGGAENLFADETSAPDDVRAVVISEGQVKDASSTRPESSATQFTWAMGDRDSIESLDVAIPLENIQEEAEKGGNIRIRWEPNASGKKDFAIRQADDETQESSGESSNKRPRETPGE